MTWGSLVATWADLGDTWTAIDSGAGATNLLGESATLTFTEGALENLDATQFIGESETLSLSEGSIEVIYELDGLSETLTSSSATVGFVWSELSPAWSGVGTSWATIDDGTFVLVGISSTETDSVGTLSVVSPVNLASASTTFTDSVGALSVSSGAFEAPTGLTAVTTSASSANVTWNPNSADFYEVERQRWVSSAWNESTFFVRELPELVDTGLISGGLYRYRVRAGRPS